MLQRTNQHRKFRILTLSWSAANEQKVKSWVTMPHFRALFIYLPENGGRSIGGRSEAMEKIEKRPRNVSACLRVDKRIFSEMVRKKSQTYGLFLISNYQLTHINKVMTQICWLHLQFTITRCWRMKQSIPLFLFALSLSFVSSEVSLFKKYVYRFNIFLFFLF